MYDVLTGCRFWLSVVARGCVCDMGIVKDGLMTDRTNKCCVYPLSLLMSGNKLNIISKSAPSPSFPIRGAELNQTTGTGPTGCFNPSGYFQTPLISFIHAPISKPFGVVIATCG